MIHGLLYILFLLSLWNPVPVSHLNLGISRAYLKRISIQSGHILRAQQLPMASGCCIGQCRSRIFFKPILGGRDIPVFSLPSGKAVLILDSELTSSR